MFKQLIKAKFIVVLFLLVFTCVSGCGPGNNLEVPSGSSGLNESAKTETRKTLPVSYEPSSTGSGPNTSGTSEAELTGKTETTAEITDLSNKSSNISGDDPTGTVTPASRPNITTDSEQAPVALDWTEIFEKINPSVASVRLKIPASALYQERE